MAWIEVHQSLPRHRKILSAGHLLDIPRMSMIGHMVCLWTWALDNAQTGDLTDLSPAVIALGAEWEGDPMTFVSSLESAGFLDRHGLQLTIHNWDNYAGRLIERRQKDRDRKKAQRMSAGLPADVRRTSSALVSPSHVPPSDSPLLTPPPYRTVPYLTKDCIETLRAIPQWSTKGEPHLAALGEWAKRKALSEDVLERSAIGLAKVSTARLLKYDNLARAFQDRVNKGYDLPSKEYTNGRTIPPAGGFDNSLSKYIEAAKSDPKPFRSPSPHPQ